MELEPVVTDLITKDRRSSEPTMPLFETGPWTIQIAPDGSYSIRHARGIALLHGRPRVDLDGKSLQPDGQWQVKTRNGGDLCVEYTLPNVCRLELTFQAASNADWLSATARLRNDADVPLKIESVTPLESSQLESGQPFDRWGDGGA